MISLHTIKTEEQPYWLTGAGVRMAVSDMSNRHLLNSIAYWNQWPGLPRPSGLREKMLNWVKEEAKRRNLA
jgi:hypothetical protein